MLAAQLYSVRQQWNRESPYRLQFPRVVDVFVEESSVATLSTDIATSESALSALSCDVGSGDSSLGSLSADIIGGDGIKVQPFIIDARLAKAKG